MSHTEDVFLVPMVLGKREGDRVRNPIPSHLQLTCLHFDTWTEEEEGPPAVTLQGFLLLEPGGSAQGVGATLTDQPERSCILRSVSSLPPGKRYFR